jgi:plasmid stability protein
VECLALGCAEQQHWRAAGNAAPDSLADSIGAISAGVVVAQVLIRQLDDRVVAILREQARARGVSLEQSLREMLMHAAQQHSDVRQRLAALRRQTPARAQELDVAALIREGREQR